MSAGGLGRVRVAAFRQATLGTESATRPRVPLVCRGPPDFCQLYRLVRACRPAGATADRGDQSLGLRGCATTLRFDATANLEDFLCGGCADSSWKNDNVAVHWWAARLTSEEAPGL